MFSQKPVTFSAIAQKAGDSNSYLITVKGQLAKNWYVYAESDTADQLTGIEMGWGNDQITKLGSARHGNTVFIRDKIFNNEPLAVYDHAFSMGELIRINGTVPASFKLLIHGFASNHSEFLPVEDTIKVYLNPGNIAGTNNTGTNKTSTNSTGTNSNKSLWGIFLLGMAGGLIALFTPCVFPMVPVTVSFFTNKAKTKQQAVKGGMTYGLCILTIYLLASIPFHLISNLNPQTLNSISTNAWVNIAFFAIFIFFALSFFGLFEISLPAGVMNKAGAKSGTGSLAGKFFMGLTLATVSFSCTGPILGSLLVGSLSANGGAWQLTAGFAGFGFALALPFALFAMFPSWLKKIPKSGGCLDIFKKILAFLELALAFKFLSNADLVMHWGLLSRPVFIIIWIIISVCLSVYLFRKSLWVLTLVNCLLTGYLAYALKNPVTILSGFAPPYRDSKLKPTVINDYARALELARQQHKLLLIDFTGWACVNCRKMEEQVWPDPAVTRIIQDRFILVSLYVDDRQKLAPMDPAIDSFSTVGEKWAALESARFRQATQPLYVIFDPNEQLLTVPVGYTPDPVTFQHWLESAHR